MSEGFDLEHELREIRRLEDLVSYATSQMKRAEQQLAEATTLRDKYAAEIVERREFIELYADFDPAEFSEEDTTDE